ncbi:hypothetical protein ACMT1E_03935 [Sphingomonas flavalba]|uniref:hypothetical protein n=1 Tax=Sphingomonas flavalba TaxID=2559804 RepID=UPI0039E1048D
MSLARIFLVSVLAPVLSCLVVSLALDGTVSGFTFIPMIFALPGSLLLLAPCYAALQERGLPIGLNYGLLVVSGGACGALMLGFLPPGQADNFAWGGLYGLSTAVFWVILHLIQRQLRGRWRRGPGKS